MRAAERDYWLTRGLREYRAGTLPLASPERWLAAWREAGWTWAMIAAHMGVGYERAVAIANRTARHVKQMLRPLEADGPEAFYQRERR